MITGHTQADWTRHVHNAALAAPRNLARPACSLASLAGRRDANLRSPQARVERPHADKRWRPRAAMSTGRDTSET
jgi:hypothetical protein